MIDQHDSLAEKFIKKWFWLYFFSFLVAPIGYIVKIIVSWELQVDEVGIIYGVMSLMILLSSFNDLGMAESLNKFLPEYITKKEYDKVKTVLFYAISAQIVTWVVIFLVFYFWANFLWEHYFKDPKSIEVVKIFAYYFLANNFFHVMNVFFQAVQNTFLQKISDAIRMIFVLLFTVGIFFLWKGSLAHYSYVWVASMFIWVAFSFLFFYFQYYRKYLSSASLVWEKSLFSLTFKYALLVFLGSQASTLLSQIDMQMIIYMLGNTDAGYFTNYLSIIGIPFLIIGPIFWFLFPVFSEMVAKNEHEKISFIKGIFTKNFLVFSLVFSFLFFVFGTLIATILFWDKFYTSGVILQFSILFISFNFLLQINFNILAAIWKIKERLHIILIAIVFNTILNYIFIKIFWVAGAALATWCGWILIWWLSERKLEKYRSPFDFKFLWKNIFIFGCISALLYAFVLPVLGDVQHRGYQFVWLSVVSCLYFWLFIGVNYPTFRNLLSSVRQVRIKKVP